METPRTNTCSFPCCCQLNSDVCCRFKDGVELFSRKTYRFENTEAMVYFQYDTKIINSGKENNFGCELLFFFLFSLTASTLSLIRATRGRQMFSALAAAAG